MPVETISTSPSTNNFSSPSPEEVEVAIKECGKIISKGSKSFALAARVFDKKTRDAAYSLYGWCRHCDDAIDDSDLGTPLKGIPSPAQAGEGGRRPDEGIQTALTPTLSRKLRLQEREKLKTLETLKTLTQEAYEGKKMLLPVFIAFQHVVHGYNIPIDYPMELLEGMAMDIRNERYPTINDLSVYCYRVAGTVGLMMTHIMGTSSDNALLHASSLGKAMQLTNIARDVRDDFEMGRVYLPMDWLKEFSIDPDRLMDPQYKGDLAKVVKRMLAVAEVYYQSGDKGLRYLKFRPACAISSARQVYSEIGKKVLGAGEKAWDKRTIVSWGRKVFVMAKGILKVLFFLPRRLFRPWTPVPIKKVWKNS